MEKVVSVEQIVEDLDLLILNGKDEMHREIVLAEIHRPGAELTGFIIENRNEIENSIHVLGKEELKYLDSLPDNIREYNTTHYMNYEFPCIIITGNLEVSEEFLTMAEIAKKPILFTRTPTEKFIKKLKVYLQKELAPEIVLNKFSLLEIFGMGIMFTGDESAKSGTTIELLEKGHRFITDELLVIKRVSEDVVIGENGYNQKTQDYNYYLNLNSKERINVIDYFGIGAARKSKEIDLIIKFEKWDETKFYDRLGLDVEQQYILGVQIPKIIIPVRKGRNLAIIVETAAINERLKKSGENSAVYFLEETQKLIQENSKKRNGGSAMESRNFLTVKELQDKFKLKILNGLGIAGETKIFTSSIHRPSLEFSGFYEILEEGGHEKIQMIGDSELKFLDRIAVEKREQCLGKYLDYNFPCIILTGVKNAPSYFLKAVKEKNKLVLSSERDISDILAEFTEFLDLYFAPAITMHGVLVEVFGFGVLIIGKSGIGKSETALELIHRNHRLIADDMVKLKKYPDGRIIGTADKVPYFMEVRGLGIIDIKTLYGLGSVRKSKQLDIIIELKELKEEDYLTKADYSEEVQMVMEEPISKIELYISSGRNAASMIEIATMNLRAKKLGYDSNEIFTKNYENIQKISNKKENLFSNISNLITGRKK